MYHVRLLVAPPICQVFMLTNYLPLNSQQTTFPFEKNRLVRRRVHTPEAHLRVLAAALEVEQVAARTQAAGLRPTATPCPRLSGPGSWRWRARREVRDRLAARAAAARRAFLDGGGIRIVAREGGGAQRRGGAGRAPRRQARTVGLRGSQLTKCDGWSGAGAAGNWKCTCDGAAGMPRGGRGTTRGWV